MKRHLTLVALALTVVGLGGPLAAAPPAAADAAKDAAPAAASAADRIVIDQFMFQPTTLTVKAGTTVTWLNMDEEPHTVVSASGLFRSVALDTNDQFTFKFTKPGSYPFVCSIHPQMIGTIVVQ